MSSSLSSLVDNLSEGLHKKKCTKCTSCLEYISIKDNKLIWKCIECNKNYKLHFNKDLIKRFANTYEFSNGHINKSILLLRKGIYLYEYMDSWKRFDEILLPNEEAFYNSLNMEDIIDVDYRHGKRVFKVFNNNNKGGYLDLYGQGNKLLLAYVFENRTNKCIEIYEPDFPQFLSAPGLASQACLKKAEIKLIY